MCIFTAELLLIETDDTIYPVFFEYLESFLVENLIVLDVDEDSYCVLGVLGSVSRLSILESVVKLPSKGFCDFLANLVF